ncbi:MAG: signal peptide peptidase SppA [Pseudomonadota bacterium]
MTRAGIDVALLPLFLLSVSVRPVLAAVAPDPTRIELPGAGLATDDGTASMATNPALFAFDPDAGLSARYLQQTDDPVGAVQLGASAGGLGFGLLYRTPGVREGLWGMHTSTALHLGDQLTLGTTFWWYLPEGTGNNFTAWDLGLGWRPLSFLGFGAVATNIGSPGAAWGAAGQYGVGLALRPWGDGAVLGVDQLFTDTAALEAVGLEAPFATTRASLTLSPRRGLRIRVWGTQRLEVGAGLQASFGGRAVGAWADDLTSGAPRVVAAVETSDPRERLVGVIKRVPIIEVGTDHPYQPSTGLFAPPQESYLHLLRRLKEAGEDPSVRGVVLHLDASPFSWGQIEELRAMIAALRDRDRPVAVYLDGATSSRDYYLASAATSVFLHPAAELDLTGLSVEMTYYRGVLDLVGVEPEFYHRSEYKSAPETWTRHEPSEPAAEEMNALLDDLWEGLVQGVADGRGLSREEAEALVDGGPYTAREAEEQGLVDGLLYPDQLDVDLGEGFPYEFLLDDDYLATLPHSGWQAPRRIAVVVVAGTINGGPSSGPGLFGGETAGAETVVQALTQARRDPTVKAVVLRVDSPGGSAFASDDIWRAVGLLRDKGKPVVVSMGGLAASGGYYVAAGADAIYAEPGTITGSIGVYGGKLSLAGLYDKVGIGSTIWQRGNNAAMWSSSKPMDPGERAAMERLIDETYAQFKQRVGEGRGLEPDQVEDLARGRVWSGRRAVENGLVDELGGLFDAVDRARDEAGLRDGARYELVTYERDADGLGELPRRLIRAATGPLRPPAALPPGLEELGSLAPLDGEHLFMLLPFGVEVR